MSGQCTRIRSASSARSKTMLRKCDFQSESRLALFEFQTYWNQERAIKASTIVPCLVPMMFWLTGKVVRIPRVGPRWGVCSTIILKNAVGIKLPRKVADHSLRQTSSPPPISVFPRLLFDYFFFDFPMRWNPHETPQRQFILFYFRAALLKDSPRDYASRGEW